MYYHFYELVVSAFPWTGGGRFVLPFLFLEFSVLIPEINCRWFVLWFGSWDFLFLGRTYQRIRTSINQGISRNPSRCFSYCSDHFRWKMVSFRRSYRNSYLQCPRQSFEQGWNESQYIILVWCWCWTLCVLDGARFMLCWRTLCWYCRSNSYSHQWQASWGCSKR